MVEESVTPPMASSKWIFSFRRRLSCVPSVVGKYGRYALGEKAPFF